ncbi:L-arabinose 1-dehydrogenase (NAD(P)(+)) [Candidatus Tiddalikarchaeum anstoanum]|nr:L-arabinose 1-dehydrogenase (NAD(P)(+)) [Candidatus Tiddalikarchaeum anstoanum]
MILVTGGTGRLGNVLVRRLVELGGKVKVLVAPKMPVDSIKDVKGVELFEGDLLDYESLNKAFKDVDIVYHLAAVVSIVSYNKDLVMNVNVNGTKNIIKACISNKVRRLVYTSTIHALSEPKKGTTITEDLGFDAEHTKGDYDKSKALASLEVLKSVKQDELDAVIVCPTGIIGPYDFSVSPFSQYVVNYVNKKQFFYIDGEYDFVDVRDVAEGMINAAKKAKKGEVFILSGSKTSVNDFNRVLEKVTGIKPPFRVPVWLSYFASFFSQVYYQITKTTPVFTPYSIQTLQRNAVISHDKAAKELGFNPRNFEESYKDQIEWFKQRGIIKY